jgi:PAS domain S-box-containing protein
MNKKLNELGKLDIYYKNIFYNAQIGIALISSDGRFLDANPKALSILGFNSFEEIKKVRIHEYLSLTPEQQKKSFETLQKENILDDIVIKSFKNNEKTTILSHTRAIKSEIGEVIFYECYLEDITERKKKEEKLESANRRLEILYQISKTLSQTLSLEGLLEKCVKSIIETFFTSGGGVLYLIKGQMLDPLVAYPQKFKGTFKSVAFGEGIEGNFSSLAALKRKTIIVNNTYDPQILDEFPLFKNDAPHCFGIFPILFEDECIALLNLFHQDQVNLFDEETVNFIQNVINQLVLFIKNVRLFDETLKKYNDLTLLYDISNRLTKYIEIDKLVKESFKIFKELGFNTSKIYLVSPNCEELELLSEYHSEVESKSLKKIKIGELFSGLAAKTLSPVIINNSHSENALKSDAGLINSNPCSFASFPIIYNNVCLGVFDLASVEVNKFTDEIINLSINIADHLSIVINNAKLYEEVLKRNKELKTLNVISSKLTQYLDLTEGCKLIYEQLKEIFNFDGFYIDLYNSKKNRLSNIINIDVVDNQSYCYVGEKDREFKSDIIKRVIFKKEPILLLRKPGENDYKGLQTFGDTGKRASSLMFAPLSSRDEIVGIISIQSYQFGSFNEKDLELFTNIANFLGISIKNILLYQLINESEIHYRTLIENIPDSIYSYTKEGLFIAVNSKTCKLLNLTEQYIMGRPVLELIPKNLRRIFLVNYKKVIDTNVPVTFEFTFEIDSKETHFITTLAPIISNEGQIMNFFGLTRDITDQKIAEENNLKMQQRDLESKRQEFIVGMTRNIAHVFNNILVNVLSRASFAKTFIEPSNKAFTHLEKIEASSRRISDLVKQLLNFSQSGRYKLELVDLNKLVQFFYVSKKISISHKIEFTMEIEKNLLNVEIDWDQIINILDKLVVNSVESIVESGVITISTKNIYQKNEEKFFKQKMPHGSYVNLEVRDNGCGIKSEIMKNFFEPFNTNKEYGRGLGLSGVYGVILYLNSFINISSELGKGTVVDIYFPVKEK